MYKYVNKKNISITVGGISFTPYSGHTSSTPVSALDIVSNGWGFDRYYNEVLANTSNDDTPIGEIRQFASPPGDGWLECNSDMVLRADYPALSPLLPTHGWDTITVATDVSGTPAPSFISGYVADNGTFFTFGNLVDGIDGSAWSSLDGVMWTQHAAFIPITGMMACFARNDVIMIAAGTFPATELAYSEDGGLSWSAAITGVTHTPDVVISAPIWDGNRFRAVTVGLATGNYQIHSVDGKNWTKTAISSPPSGGSWDVIVAYARDGGYSYTYSTNGLNKMASYNGTIELSIEHINPTNAIARPRISEVAMMAGGMTLRVDEDTTLGFTPSGGLAKGDGYIMTPIPEAGINMVGLFKFNGMVCAVTVFDGGITLSTDLSSWKRFVQEGLGDSMTISPISRQDMVIIPVLDVSTFSIVMIRMTVNPLKMLLPYMPAIDGIRYYVYTGA